MGKKVINMEEDKQSGSAQQTTLTDAIRELNAVSWRLTEIVFGQNPVSGAEKEEKAQDVITNSRNEIMNAIARFKNVADKLELLGK